MGAAQDAGHTPPPGSELRAEAQVQAQGAQGARVGEGAGGRGQSVPLVSVGVGGARSLTAGETGQSPKAAGQPRVLAVRAPSGEGGGL